MEPTAWHSRLAHNLAIGDKPGFAHKWFGRDWDPPQFILPLAPPGNLEWLRAYGRGEPLPREAFPEALSVFDPKQFAKLGELFAAGGFYVVRGELVGILRRFDLGQGGLIPLPVYAEDKKTPTGGECFLWQFGAKKSAFLAKKSHNIRPRGYGSNISYDRWDAKSTVRDGDIALSAAVALPPPDVWCDPQLPDSLFFSDALASALLAGKFNVDFMLTRCRLI